MRKNVILICEECLSRNYHTSKNPYLQNRLELRKFCSACNQYTLHKESR
ncbi:MAG: 50S ribosomal protein L33 [Ureaplasma sp.]|nr:50S ribosomal protein L33 [Ureaplasma sp.]